KRRPVSSAKDTSYFNSNSYACSALPKGIDAAPITTSLLLIMANMEDIAVANDVVAMLLPHQIVCFNFALASKPDQVVTLHNLGANEALRQVGVNASRGFHRRRPLGYKPCANFLFPCG